MHAILLLLVSLLSSLPACADAGTLIPRDKQAPDPSILSLEEMRVEITIDNGDAHVYIVQIFANHTNKVEEGTYRFSLPAGSTISDFAVWDGAVRIPAVILERKRAEQVYDEARSQAIDPGLLEAGERDDKDPKSTSLFTAKIVPIPAYGTKRLELDYHQHLTVTDFKSFFALPLKPDAGQQQSVHSFSVHLVLHSVHAIEELTSPSKLFPLTFKANDAHGAEGSFSGSNVALGEDFQLTWRIAAQGADKLEIITHRDARTPLPTAGGSAQEMHVLAAPGFFEAQLLVGDPPTEASQSGSLKPAPVRTFLLLFDTSLSMQWEKLERSYAALEGTLRSLKAGAQFNVLLFNREVAFFQPRPVQATAENIRRALDYVRASKLRGGTDLLKALDAALAQCSQPETSIVLFTDGGSDLGESVVPQKIGARYAAQWEKSPHPPHTAVFAVGDDADLPLLRSLVHNGGFVEPVRSTEPVEFHLQTFLSKLTRNPVPGLALEASPAQTSYVYSLDDSVYPGSMAEWVGQYSGGAQQLSFTVHGRRDGQSIESHAQTLVSATSPEHPELPRLWAQARVNALLEQIARDGETAAAIDEIIRLSRRYKFITPYTSFLAVPRSLLRPRVIRPGDPVLRVRTDSQIDSVIALFPFGLTKPLRHLPSEDLKAPGDAANRLWETRFLAPPEMKDGTYSVRLILRDSHGNTYRETKTFVIASTPPTVKLQLGRTSVHRGESLAIRAAATASTRTLLARMDGTAPVTLHWDGRAASNTGRLEIPPDLPIGRYTLTVTAEDIAHNLGSQEVSIDVLP